MAIVVGEASTKEQRRIAEAGYELATEDTISDMEARVRSRKWTAVWVDCDVTDLLSLEKTPAKRKGYVLHVIRTIDEEVEVFVEGALNVIDALERYNEGFGEFMTVLREIGNTEVSITHVERATR